MESIPGLMTESFFEFAKNPQNTQAILDIQKGLITAPNRAEMVQWVLKSILDNREFMKLFEKKYIPRFPSNEELAATPEGSLGRAVLQHLTANGIALDFAGLDTSIYYQQEMSPPVYLGLRALRMHDVWHAVLGLGVSPLDEYALASFQLGQFYSPNHMTLLSAGYLNVAFYTPEEIPKFLDQTSKFYQMGRAAKFFAGFQFEENWSTPLRDVRTMLGVNLD